MTGDHDTLLESAAEYALGTMTAADRQMFEAHLAHCVECQREVRELAAVSEALARSVDPIDPPPALRARVLAAATASATNTAIPISTAGAARPVVVRDRRSMTPLSLAAAAAIAMLVSGGLAWSYRQEAARLSAELAGVREQVRTLASQVATLETTAANARQTSAVLTAVDLTRVDLAGQSAAPVSTGRVFWSASSGLVFTATNLPELPEGRVYQLWVVDESPHSAGIVSPDAAGRLNVVTAEPISAMPKAFALTIEPEGGRPAPTGPMFLLGAL